jgi:hypothetical protein
MPETFCNDVEKVHAQLTPVPANGVFDSPPVWTVVSGNGTVVADADGMGADLVSEDNVSGPGPFDTVYHYEAMAMGAVVTGENIILHVSNDLPPATGLGVAFSAPTPK